MTYTKILIFLPLLISGKKSLRPKPINKLYFALLVYFNGKFGKRYYYPTDFYLTTVFHSGTIRTSDYT